MWALKIIIILTTIKDIRVDEREQEQGDKYQHLGREIKRLWKFEVTVIPIVIGTFLNNAKRSGRKPENTLGIASNSMNAKQGTGAWIEDNKREKVIC